MDTGAPEPTCKLGPRPFRAAIRRGRAIARTESKPSHGVTKALSGANRARVSQQSVPGIPTRWLEADCLLSRTQLHPLQSGCLRVDKAYIGGKPGRFRATNRVGSVRSRLNAFTRCARAPVPLLLDPLLMAMSSAELAMTCAQPRLAGFVPGRLRIIRTPTRRCRSTLILY